jgi:adenine-specific DNA-methyltransferase
MLGILNSQLFQWLFATRFFDYEIKPVYLRSAPLADVNDPSLVAAVEEMIRLRTKLSATCTSHERANLERQIESTDGEIDACVYRIYGLKEHEIQIIEQSRPLPLENGDEEVNDNGDIGDI